MYVSQVINEALSELIESNPAVYLLGEDIQDPYGGAFKITKNLSSRFPSRVINTPISEASLTGIAVGMAMRGLRPVLEIMFGDFITLCMDQLVNHASKFQFMYNGQVKIPVFIRVPMGGRRGYGPTHSQTLEKLLLGIPGIKIIAPSHMHPVKSIYLHAVKTEEMPVILIENKMLYTMQLQRPKHGRIGDFAIRESNDPYPCLTMSLTDFEDTDATVVTYGGMLPFVERAVTKLFVEEEVAIEIVVPSLLGVPLEVSWINPSLSKTGRLFIVEEGNRCLGFGAEVAALVSEEYFHLLKAPIKRIAALDCPIPCAIHLEDIVLPSEFKIYQEFKRSLKWLKQS